MPTWTDEQLIRWMKAGEDDINSQIHSRMESFSLAITEGTATYTFNRRIKGVLAILWKGNLLAPYIAKELHGMYPEFQTREGEPKAYQMSNDGISTLRLIPVPNESIAEYETGLLGSNIRNAFIIRAQVFPDNDLDYIQLPDYVFRNLMKSYVLARAFFVEGIGQNLNAARYWESHYMHMVDEFKILMFDQHETKEQLHYPARVGRSRQNRLQNQHYAVSGHTFQLLAAVNDLLNNWSDIAEVNLA